MKLFLAVHTSPARGPVGYRWLNEPPEVGRAVLAKAYDRILPDLPNDTAELRDGRILCMAGMASVDDAWAVIYRVLYGGRDAKGRDSKVYLACGFFRREQAQEADLFALLEQPFFCAADESGTAPPSLSWQERLQIEGSEPVLATDTNHFGNEAEVRNAMIHCLMLPREQHFRLACSQTQTRWDGRLLMEPTRRKVAIDEPAIEAVRRARPNTLPRMHFMPAGALTACALVAILVVLVSCLTSFLI